MKILNIEYGKQNWAIEIEVELPEKCQIGLYLFKEKSWDRYGSVTITKQPTSCLVSFERNMMPYVVIRELIKLTEEQIVRIGVNFDEKVCWETV
jgi:hypothetical protein